MADLAKYRQDIEKFNTSYAKAAIKEPVNFWGLAGFLVAAAYTGSVIPLLIALVCEAIYLVVVPIMPSYRQLVNRREKERLLAAHIASRDKLIKSFTPREREAVEYLRWVADKNSGRLQKIHRRPRIADKSEWPRSALGRFC